MPLGRDWASQDNPRTTLLSVLTDLSLLTNLRLCLDAGDALSAPASPTKWLDRSGNGYDFFLGPTGGADAEDPTFEGSVGGLTSLDRWGLNGSQFFRYDTTNEAWMENVHKNNAIFSIAAWVQMGALGTNAAICGTQGAFAGGTGFSLFVVGSGLLQLQVINAGSGVLAIDTSTPNVAITGNVWAFVAASLNEAVGANGAFLQINASQQLKTSTYVSPAAGNASFAMEIGARGDANLLLPAASRIGSFAMWEGAALTQAQLTAIYEATRGRYGV